MYLNTASYAPEPPPYTSAMAVLRRVLGVVMVAASLLPAIEREPVEVFQGRRRALTAKHPNGVILLFGYGEDEAQSARSPFRQENNFYYLSGWNEPGAAMVLFADPSTHPAYREVLFLPERNPSQEQWSGRRTTADDPNLKHKTGFSEILAVTELDGVLREALELHGRVYSLLPRRHASHAQQPEPDRTARIERLAPGYPKADIRGALESMRTVKSAGEIRLIQRAVDATIAAHLAAWKRLRPGLWEYQVTATMIGTMMDRGCLQPAYAPIVGSGLNGTILHYASNNGRLQPGQFVLIDVGGEYGHYAADITRSAPVDGAFSARQRQIYEIVLGAQKAAIAAVKPGMTLSGQGPSSLAQVVREYLASRGNDHNGASFSEYLSHALGHHVGLEVHDPGGDHTPLEPGMVITIEPGLYLPQEKLGVRIEDMLLVTADGARVLSAGLPREVDDIERIMQTP